MEKPWNSTEKLKVPLTLRTTPPTVSCIQRPCCWRSNRLVVLTRELLEKTDRVREYKRRSSSKLVLLPPCSDRPANWEVIWTYIPMFIGCQKPRSVCKIVLQYPVGDWELEYNSRISSNTLYCHLVLPSCQMGSHVDSIFPFLLVSSKNPVGIEELECMPLSLRVTQSKN